MRWLKASFTPQDYVLVKMDVEGAEHAVVQRLAETGALRLVDRLALECHHLLPHGYDCNRTLRTLEAARVDVVPDKGCDRRIKGRRVNAECYEQMSEDFWRGRVEEYRRDLLSSACAHLNVSLAPQAVAERLLWSGEDEQRRQAVQLLRRHTPYYQS